MRVILFPELDNIRSRLSRLSTAGGGSIFYGKLGLSRTFSVPMSALCLVATHLLNLRK